jgi:hypothetical protein
MRPGPAGRRRVSRRRHLGSPAGGQRRMVAPPVPEWRRVSAGPHASRKVGIGLPNRGLKPGRPWYYRDAASGKGESHAHPPQVHRKA